MKKATNFWLKSYSTNIFLLHFFFHTHSNLLKLHNLKTFIFRHKSTFIEWKWNVLKNSRETMMSDIWNGKMTHSTILSKFKRPFPFCLFSQMNIHPFLIEIQCTCTMTGSTSLPLIPNEQGKKNCFLSSETFFQLDSFGSVCVHLFFVDVFDQMWVQTTKILRLVDVFFMAYEVRSKIQMHHHVLLASIERDTVREKPRSASSYALHYLKHST